VVLIFEKTTSQLFQKLSCIIITFTTSLSHLMSFPKQLDKDKLPAHVAIIMDGNGRWAKKQNLLRTYGHKVGVDTVKKIVECSRKIGIQVLTLYAFSTENWQRPKLEVQTLMKLLKTYLNHEINNLIKNNIRLTCIGQKEKLPSDVLLVLNDTIQKTSTNDGMVLNLALSYGSRDEIVRALKTIAQKCLVNSITPDDISSETINDHLYTAGLPDPDLIIRTGGESRLSNFLLWQIASYSEIFIDETPRTDFREKQFISALENFQSRQRRFGKTGDQVTNKNIAD